MFSIFNHPVILSSLRACSVGHFLDGSLPMSLLVYVCLLMYIVHNGGFRVVAAARIGRRFVLGRQWAAWQVAKLYWSWIDLVYDRLLAYFLPDYTSSFPYSILLKNSTFRERSMIESWNTVNTTLSLAFRPQRKATCTSNVMQLLYCPGFMYCECLRSLLYIQYSTPTVSIREVRSALRLNQLPVKQTGYCLPVCYLQKCWIRSWYVFFPSLPDNALSDMFWTCTAGYEPVIISSNRRHLRQLLAWKLEPWCRCMIITMLKVSLT